MRNIVNSRVLAVTAGAAAFALVAGGTGAVAGSMVGSPQIHDNSIRSKDIRNGAVSGKDLRNGVEKAIQRRATKAWVADNFATHVDLDEVDGADGAPGVENFETIGRGTDAAAVAAGETVTLTSKCAPGEVVTSGGVKGTGFVVRQSFPSSITQVGEETEADPSGVWSATEWTVVVRGDEGGSAQPFLVCTNLK